MVQIEKLFSKLTSTLLRKKKRNASRLLNFVQSSEGLISTSKFHSLKQLQVFRVGGYSTLLFAVFIIFQTLLRWL